MRPKTLQCKHIPDGPVLAFLAAYAEDEWCNWYDLAVLPASVAGRSVRRAMPPGTPDKLVLAKMRMLLDRGVVTGCGCGCRGDFVITDKGRQELQRWQATAEAV